MVDVETPNKLGRKIEEKKLEELLKKLNSYESKSKNKSVIFSKDKYIEVCPNDNKTKLKVKQLHSYSDGKGNICFEEFTYCPDCDCLVYRKPPANTLRGLKKRGVCSGEVSFP